MTSSDIFPEYYVICVGKFDDKIRDNVDEWIYLFKHATTQADFHSPGIDAAEAKLDYLGMSPAERAKYDADLDAASNLTSEFATAIADGKREGETIDVKKGKLETARKMLSMKLSLDLIEQATGIPVAELLKLNLSRAAF